MPKRRLFFSAAVPEFPILVGEQRIKPSLRLGQSPSERPAL